MAVFTISSIFSESFVSDLSLIHIFLHIGIPVGYEIPVPGPGDGAHAAIGAALDTEIDPEVIVISVSYTHLDVYKRQALKTPS